MEYTSEELRSVIHTVPSVSLEADWNETCERIKNRNITEIQMQFHTQVSLLENGKEEWIGYAIKRWKLTVDQAVLGVEVMIKKRTEEFKKETERLISFYIEYCERKKLR